MKNECERRKPEEDGIYARVVRPAIVVQGNINISWKMTAFAFTQKPPSISRATGYINYSASKLWPHSRLSRQLPVNQRFVFTFPNDFDLRISQLCPDSKSSNHIGWLNRRLYIVSTLGNQPWLPGHQRHFHDRGFPGTTLYQLLGRNNLEQAAGYYADRWGGGGIDPLHFAQRQVFLVITIPAVVGRGPSHGNQTTNGRSQVSTR